MPKMPGTPLLFAEPERIKVRALRELAAQFPVDMPRLMEQIETREGKRVHMDQMNRQSVEIPMGYLVSFSIETGHPCGTCRHMSMSSPRPGRLPIQEAVWMVAEELGFNGGLSACRVWIEELQRPDNKRHNAINVVQPITVLSAMDKQ